MMKPGKTLTGSMGKNGSYRWLLTALLRAVAVIVCVTIAVFFLIRIVPGDPAKMILGEYGTPEAIADMHHTLGLDLPLWEQFLRFAKTLFTAGDTGSSIISGTSTRALIAERAPVTLLLIILACTIAVVIALLLSVIAATNKDKLPDHLIRIFPTITLGMPIFWVGILLIMLLSVRLHWFPVGGVGEGWRGTLYSLTLPAVTVAFSQIPTLVRSLRAQMLEVLESDFVVTLRAARIPARIILFKHVLRNSALPTLMLLGVNISYLIGGTLVVEQVFGIKGIGSLLFTSIAKRDFPVIQGIALYCAVSVVIISLLTEIIAKWLDPRTDGKR
ncbi:peptide/nickel transport system permease protein [Paenibacillus sp. NFR01]|nr:peptide/nickel transport system permease protein [Paenibacillus sp. NFR01]